jgi:hypothetical protein
MAVIATGTVVAGAALELRRGARKAPPAGDAAGPRRSCAPEIPTDDNRRNP